MTGSPFSNVVGHDPGDNTWYKQGLSTQVGDTTTATAARPRDDATESSVGVEVDAQHGTHESEQDETASQSDTSGTYTAGT